MKDNISREQQPRIVTHYTTPSSANETQNITQPRKPSGLSAQQIAQRKLQETGQALQLNNNPVSRFHALKEKGPDSNNTKTAQRKEADKANNTGLPDNLKTGVENLSGHSMDDVKVHYNSEKPSQLQAHAYAQGTDIHIAPGQEKHLPHEAWHVVQQKQGRVQSTVQMKGDIEINDDKGLEKEADEMGAKAQGTISEGTKPVIQKTISGKGVIQGQWVTVQETGERLNLKATEEPDIYLHTNSGAKYKVVSRATDGTVTVTKVNNAHSEYSYSNFDTYKNWTNKTSGVTLTGPFGGTVSAFHNRGAPKIGSRPENYGGAALKDTYAEYVRGLKSGGQTEAEIAQALLDLDDTTITSDLQRRAADMLHITVYLAEEWRKQGAAKIYRAILRLIANGDKTFKDFLEDFYFIASADDGRALVARFYDVFNGDKSVKDLPKNEKVIYDEVSDMETEDFSSDDEMRKDDKKNLSKNRLNAQKHKGSTGWKSAWS